MYPRSSNRYVLASDLGSGSCKTMLLDETARIAGKAAREYPTCHPKPGWVEQRPDDWYRSFIETVREVLSVSGVDPERIQAVGLVGVTHNTVLLDGRDRPLGNAILTFDQRSVEQCRQIEEKWGDEVFRRTLNAPSPLWSWPQLLWIRQNDRERWGLTRRLLFQKDYVRHRLAPGYLTDTIDAAGTLLYDPSANQWIPEFCSDLGVDPSALPRLSAPMDVVSQVSSRGAADTGLREGTPVIAGTTDTVAEVFGSGLLRPGQGMVKLASVGRLAVVSKSPLHNQRILNYRHVIPGLWYPGSGTKSAATSPRWLRDSLWGDQSFAEIDAAASQVPPGSEGLLFHPHLHGEWAPHWNEELRANFIGATARHNRAHFSRAVLEGVAFSLRDAIEYLAEVGLTYTEYRLIGGGARSPLWRRIVCDVLGRPITVPRHRDAVYGAALITAVAAGLFELDVERIEGIVPVEDQLEPDPATHECYCELFDLYRRSDRALAPIASGLRSFENKYPGGSG
jgi:xylulokinase